MKTRARVYVRGLVQGVFFRVNTMEKARALGLTGWVRNTEDGGVEAVFEGEKEAIEEMIEFCRHGPDGARVESIDVKQEKHTGHYTSFEVLY